MYHPGIAEVDMRPYKRTWTKADGSKGVGWRVRYRDATGKEIRRQFETRKDALRFLEGLPPKGEPTAKPTPTSSLMQAAEMWLEEGRKGRDGRPPLERKTLETYTYLVTVLRQAGGDIPLASLDRAALEALRDRVLAEAASRSLAVRVWKHCLMPVLKLARAKGWVSVDPTGIAIHRDTRAEDPEDRFEVHTPEQMRAILAKAEEWRRSTRKDTSRSWRRLSLILHLLVYCGLRSSEIRGLPRDAVDLQAMTLKVRQRADEWGAIGSPKSAHAYRTLAIPAPLAPLLREWMEHVPSGSLLLFPAKDGDPLTLSYLRKRMWEPIQKAAGVPYRNLHATRHFFASRLIQQGATLKELQTALGHHDAAFTLRTYGHLFGGEEAEKRKRQLAESLVL